MTDQPTLTRKGRLIAFGVSAVLCIAAIEGISRVFDSGQGAVVEMQLNLQPYMMFAGSPQQNPMWRDVVTNTDVPSRMKFNNYGFAIDDNFTLPPNEAFSRKFVKQPEDRIVVTTGGSVVHGVGATANDKTIAGQLEAILNQKQSKYRYRVVNLGMGSWIAYQQFLGLSLFGLPLKPDWVVVMDGHNDAAVACPHGSGPGNPLGWPKMLYLTGGGEGATRRSPLMDWLVRNTAVARVVTGQRPAGQNNQLGQLYFDDKDPDTRFNIKMRNVKMGGLDEQVGFYLLAEQNVKELFASGNVIFSSQPYLYDNAISPLYRKAFDPQAAPDAVEADKKRLKAELDAYMAKASQTPCTASVSSQALGYFAARAALRLEQVAAEWSAPSKERSIVYTNTEMVLPLDHDQRVPNFIDNAHMSDLGQHRVAQLFAGYILQSDLKMPFDPAALAKAVNAEAAKVEGASHVQYPYSPPPATPAKTVAAKPVLEGITAKERSPGVVQLDESPENGFHRIRWTDVPVAAGKGNTLTIDAWSDAIAAIRLEMADGAKSYGRADFNLFKQKVIATNGKDVVAKIDDLGKGWKRLVLTMPLAANSASFNVSLLSGSDVVSYPGSNRSLSITEPALASK